MIRLRVLGSLELRDRAGAELSGALAQPKRLALLVFLAMRPAGAFVRRDTLFAMFWPEADETHARSALNQAVRFLRRQLGDDAEIIINRGAEELAADPAKLWCDAAEFRRAVERSDLESALDLYKGDFLVGFHAHDAEGFEEWSARERNALRAGAADAARVLAERREHDGDIAGALTFAARAAELSDVDERRMRHLLVLLDRLGDRGGAIAAFDRFAARLDTEYGTEPSVETRALVDRIRSRAEVNTSVLADLTRAAATESLDKSPAQSHEVRSTSKRRRWWVPAVIVVLGALGLSLTTRSPKPLVAGFAQALAATAELELDPALSPDGRFVAYASGADRHETHIYVRPVAGGAAVLRSGDAPGDQRWPVWTADGSSIVFVAASRQHVDAGPAGLAFIAPALSGPSRQLSEPGEVLMTPSISDDGALLIYSDGQRILLRPLLGGSARVIATGNEVHSPVIAPDGQHVAYVQGNQALFNSFNVAASSVWVSGVDGRGAHRVSDSTHMNIAPAWRRDSRSLLFVSDIGGRRDVYEQALNRSYVPVGQPTRLTTGVDAISLNVAHDGESITYASARFRSEIWASPLRPQGAAGGSQLQRLSNVNENVEGIDVTHDGRWLVFDSNRRGNPDLYKVPVAGGEPVQLTHDPAPDFIPQWSPDGSHIAYYSMRSGNRDVRVMNAEGGEDQSITSSPGDEVYPSWSGDGRSIVYAKQSGTRGSLVVRELLRDGHWSPERTIVAGEMPPRFPRWSWDGRWIVYNIDGKQLNVVSPTTREVRTVATPAQLAGEKIEFGAWGAASDTVYVHSQHMFWSVPLGGGAPRVLLDPRRMGRYTRRQEFATDGKRLFFTLAADESDVWLLRLKR